MSTSVNGIDISVIIATCKRPFSLCETLLDLAKQETEGQFTYEVIVVDNNSRDETASVVRALMPEYPVPLTCYEELEQGKAYALNKGIGVARGALLAFTDNDIRLGKDWLKIIHETFVLYHADGVGGPTKPLWVGTRPDWLSDQLVRQLGIFDHGQVSFVIKEAKHFIIGANCAYRKSLFEKYGGYEPKDTFQDVGWFLEMLKLGHKIVYRPEMTVQHKVDSSEVTINRMKRRFWLHGRNCSLGISKEKPCRTICRIPLWTIRLTIELHFLALKEWLCGNRDEALWHWLRRYIYLGMIYYCFQDWLYRRPKTHDRPKIIFQDLNDKALET